MSAERERRRAGSGPRAWRRVRRALGPERPAPGSVPTPTTSDDPTIFFLVGRAKSGTSWLMNLLDSHPDVVCLGEGLFFGTSHVSGEPGVRSLQQTLLESEAVRDWASRSAWTRKREHEAVANRLTASIVRHLLGGSVASSEAHIVGDKTPLHGPDVVVEIGKLLPDARVIHIIRDGRDVILSGAHHRWNQVDRRDEGPASAVEAEIRDAYRADPEGYLAAGRTIFGPGALRIRAANWARWTAAAAEAGRKLGPERYAEIRYEQIGVSGAEELLRLWTFLGAEASIEQANEAIAANDFQRLAKGRPAGAEDSAAFLRSGVAGDWRRVFTAEDREIFERAAGEVLIELGYERDSRWVEMT